MILLTGGAGHIGSLVCRNLLKEGHKVTVLDKLMFGDSAIRTMKFFYPESFEIITGDIQDTPLLEKVLEGKDTVVHLAAIVGDPACAAIPEETKAVNLDSTKIIADLSDKAGVERFVFSSTCSVYGASEDWLDETSEAMPISLYGSTKHDAEQHLIHKEFKNMDVVALRLGTVFGLSPRMRFDLVVNFLTQKAIIDRHIKIFGGDQWRPLVHVKDIARSFSIVALFDNWDNVKGEIFNVGANELNYQLASMAEIFKAIFPYAQVEILESMSDQRSYRVNCSKINKTFGFKTKYDLEAGIREISQAIWDGVIQNPNSEEYFNYRIWE